MSSVFARIRARVANPWLKWVAAPAAVVAVIGSVVGAGLLPPEVQLATEPLYARGARAKPTLTLALSVEYPTVGAQYLGAPVPAGQSVPPDDTYAPTSEYVGYFDAAGCYAYNDAPAEPAAAGLSAPDYKRFDRTGDAARNADGTSRHTCANDFSGNFMNWASSSAIDILRLGLSGGDRVIDTNSGFTVLQRAYLPDTFWNSNDFPTKVLKAPLAAGAVPKLLLRTADGIDWTGDVYIANCRNRIAFGTHAEGDCGHSGHNADLGAKIGGIPVNGHYDGELPPEFTFQAVENTTYTTTATKQVAYGAGTQWAILTLPAGVINCSNTLFGDPIQNVAKQCYDRDPVGSTGIGITSDGFLYTRVQVCASSAGNLLDPRPSLCVRYASGGYKPVGNLQKYSDRLRVAAFGYLNDSTDNPNERYGGVLRAPMKYVGPKSYDANFSLSSGTNPDAEWDEQTGVLKTNPTPWSDPAVAEVRSGVINYLNQFGRTGTTPGTYKTYDPVSELYYESLRYLQGLPPTPAALPEANASPSDVSTWKDGFPIYSTWNDPHPPTSTPTDYSCVRNNILAIGDVNTHNDKTIPGNPSSRAINDEARAANPAANVPDFYQWTKVVGAFESNHAEVSYVDGKGVTQSVSNPNRPPNTDRWGMENQNPGRAKEASYYMAGMAYWANTHDIRGTDWTVDSKDANGVSKQRPGMRVTTYVLDVNEYGDQNDPNTRHNNQFFLTAKYGGFKDSAGVGSPYLSVAKPGDAASAGNASWESAPGSLEAKNYFLSSSAQAVLKALDDIFASIATESNSIAGGAISTQRLTSTPDFIYQAQFNPAAWSGDVAAVPVSASASGGAVSVGSSASGVWTSAAQVLDDRRSARKIYAGSRDNDFHAVSFEWNDALGATIKAALKTPLGSTTATDNDNIGKLRLNYLSGDRSQEGNGFRKRGSALGDIVNSGIVYSGALPERFDSASYGSFYANNKDRPPALFVGANDGMLHAFSVKDGSELFAYIPSWVVPKLSALTSPDYAHQSYVDATPSVSEALVGTDWKTVLVSGTGGGGQGVFALDVSSSDKFDENKVMWEFTDADDTALGNVIGVPQILPMRVGASTTPTYFAVFGSGVNNHAADGHASSTGAAALFLLKLGKSASEKWVKDTNYFRIDLPDPDLGLASGLANFTARVDAAGLVSTLYAGDLQGNLWKLDFGSVAGDSTKWTLADLTAFKSGTTPLPLYIALDGNSANAARQPITMAPSLVYGPNGSIVVAFGTGKFLELADISGTYKTQTVYAVLDDGTSTVASNSSQSSIEGRAYLSQGTVTGGAVSVGTFDWGRPSSTGGTVKAGWYLDLPQSVSVGERQISGFELLGSQAVFGTVIPPATTCDKGSGNLYVVDLLSGIGTTQTSTVGIFAQPMIRRVDDAGLIELTRSDTNGRRVQTLRKQIVLMGSAGVDAPATLSDVSKVYVGRLSWRELAVRR